MSISVTGGGCAASSGGTEDCETPEDEGGPDDCEKPDQGQSTGDGNDTSNQAEDPIDLRTGSKIERAVDLTVALPGRDFRLAREYVSDLGPIDSGAGNETMLGVNWTLTEVAPVLLANNDENGDIASMVVLGRGRGGKVRFLPLGTTPEEYWSVGASKLRVREISAAYDVEGQPADIWRMWAPGGRTMDFVATSTTGTGTFGPQDLHGVLVRQTDTYGNTWDYDWDEVSAAGVTRTRVRKITFTDAISKDSGNNPLELGRVEFDWLGDSGAYTTSDSNLVGRLARARVFRDAAPADPTQIVEYSYYEQLVDGTAPADTGVRFEDVYEAGDGDLVEVVVSTKTDTQVASSPRYHEKVWQYRYFHSGIGGDSLSIEFGPQGASTTAVTLEGSPHQLLAVFRPEQIEFYADQVARAGSAANWGGAGVPGEYDPGGGATDYVFADATVAARRLRYTALTALAGDTSDFTGQSAEQQWATTALVGTEFFSRTSDIASKIVGYYDEVNNDPRSGRVKTQFVASATGAGCGCAASSGSVNAKRYDYLYRWSELPNLIATDFRRPGDNGYTVQIVESYSGPVGTGTDLGFIPYRLEATDYYYHTAIRGWRKMAEAVMTANPAWAFDHDVDPFLASPDIWATLYSYQEDRVPQAVIDETDSAYGAIYRAYSPAASTGYLPATRDLADDAWIGTGLVWPHVMNDSTGTDINITSGLITEYDVNVVPLEEAYRTRVGVLDGENGSGAQGTADILQEWPFPRPVTDREDLIGTSKSFLSLAQQVTATMSYGLHGGDPDRVASIKRELTREGPGGNGPAGSGVYTSWELYDERGDLRWLVHEDGSFTSFSYDQKTGRRTQIVRNAPHGSLTAGDFPGFTKPADPGFAADALTTSMTYDDLGRLRSTTRTDGRTTTIRRELRGSRIFGPEPAVTTSVPHGIEYFAMVTVPHRLASGEFDGPVSVAWMRCDGGPVTTSRYEVDASAYTAQLTAANVDAIIAPANEVARSDHLRSLSGTELATRVWHSTLALQNDGDGDGSLTDGYDEVVRRYDGLGRLTLEARGDVLDTAGMDATGYSHDLLDRVTEVKRGVTDGTDIKLSGTAVTIARYAYDGAALSKIEIGNSNLTIEEMSDGEGAARVTERDYDYRDRAIRVLNPEPPHASYAYDVSSNVTAMAEWGTVPDLASISLPNPSMNQAGRIGLQQTLYNARGLAYKQAVAIEPATGMTLSSGGAGVNALETNRWYDERGRVAAVWGPNSPVTVNEYDGLSRISTRYVTDGVGLAVSIGSSGAYDDITTVADSRVYEQVSYAYIADEGLLDLVTTRMRNHDASGPGLLDITNSVVTYSAYGYDTGRLEHMLNFGSPDPVSVAAGQEDMLRSDAPVSATSGRDRSADALVTTTLYDSWGRAVGSQDPAGRITRTVLDAASRPIATIEHAVSIGDAQIDWDAVDQRWSVNWPGGTVPADADRVTTMVYDPLGNVRLRVAHVDDGGSPGVQATEYVYGTTAGTASNVADTLVASRSLLREVKYPDEGTGEPGSAANYTVSYAYNALGELRFMRDQNQTEHTYDRDTLGRITLDDVDASSTVPVIDTRVDRVSYSYDEDGLLEKVSSLSSGGAVLDSVRYGYTGLDQIASITQSHDGDVDSMSPPTIGVVSYVYDNKPVGATTSAFSHSRLSKIVYPNEQGKPAGEETVKVEYGSANSTNDRMSRANRMLYYDQQAVVDQLMVTYGFVGHGMFARANYHDKYRLTRTEDGNGLASAGLYPGFDRYGRVKRQLWLAEDTSNGTVPLFDRMYGYDEASNRVFDIDDRGGAFIKNRDWMYEYDGLHRLTKAYRGARNTTGLTPSDSTWDDEADFTPFNLASAPSDPERRQGSQRWGLDILGNWDRFDQAWADWSTGTGEITGWSNPLTFQGNPGRLEERDHNLANELTAIDAGVGVLPVPPPESEPIYDDNGNKLSDQDTATIAQMHYTYDAWNRLTKIERDRDGMGTLDTVAEFQYNGLGWRTVHEADRVRDQHFGANEERVYYYDASWRMVEEGVDYNDTTRYFDTSGNTAPDGTVNRRGQQFWGLRYIDDAVARRIDRDGDGNFHEPGDDDTGIFFYITDAQFSVRALTKERSGTVVEWIDYSPYGEPYRWLAGDWDASGSADSFDVLGFLAAFDTQQEVADLATPFGTFDTFDVNMFLTVFDAADTVDPDTSLEPAAQAGVYMMNASDNRGFETDNQIGYAGYMRGDNGGRAGMWHVRHRVLDPSNGRWVHRDPAGYVDGSSRYQYARSSPVRFSDWMGRVAGEPGQQTANPRYPDWDDPSKGCGITVRQQDLTDLGEYIDRKGNKRKHRWIHVPTGPNSSTTAGYGQGAGNPGCWSSPDPYAPTGASPYDSEYPTRPGGEGVHTVIDIVPTTADDDGFVTRDQRRYPIELPLRHGPGADAGRTSSGATCDEIRRCIAAALEKYSCASGFDGGYNPLFGKHCRNPAGDPLAECGLTSKFNRVRPGHNRLTINRPPAPERKWWEEDPWGD